MMKSSNAFVSAVILAGGKGQRMKGKDKGLVLYQGKTLVEHVIATIEPQVNEIIIIANRNLTQYQQMGYGVFSDDLENFQGPLAGILKGLKMVKHQKVIICPCDTPNLPNNLVKKLTMLGSFSSYAFDGVYSHPTVCYLQKTHYEPLNQFLLSGQRKLMDWLKTIDSQPVNFSNTAKSFKNINTLDELV